MSGIEYFRQTPIGDIAHFASDIIDEIGAKSQRPFLFRDVSQACAESRAFVFGIKSTKSFVVLRPMTGNMVQVWVAHCTDGYATQTFLPIIKKLCRDIGADTIEFETAIESMERLMPRHGWAKAYTVWRQSANE